ncbi:DUF2156 domain-containing protein [Ruminococcus flavefaciens]|uniref:DUF2156 domain-containing protein n=1 Tax=Ruminococcus flavefaciens TaxID=1265 RepID=UPI0026EEEF82|nr:phosphatidylglycerol lysyltransferase domain-containing protein [Ruminococcus flavefaciens]MDD7516630.1 phosphatidylglycerol lysyltransferase domain-containing protein [Ruminococcus flavefaciens]MDY5691113.1 phosphatidylglycerol lysyltransferase domain-containing protein [Ruminococcus flavefaciens]
MLEFREINIKDKDRITSALEKSQFMGCEYSFSNNMAWRRLGDSLISFYKDFYICCSFRTDDGIPHFFLPSGMGDYRAVINAMKEYAEYNGKPLKIAGITDRSMQMMNEFFADKFIAETDDGDWDYIYNSSDLIELPGRKYHGKRNHLARFNELDFQFSMITEKDFDDCITFSAMEYNNRSSEPDHSFIAEQYAINTYFNYFNELGLKGGVIRIGGKVAAFTIGDKLNNNTFCVHIEKADTNFNGIYAGINNYFAREAASAYKYINREEDLGIEGLRKAKQSYHPAILLKKYIVTFK